MNVIHSFEESIEDLHQNFKSFGFDLAALVEQKKLFISHAASLQNPRPYLAFSSTEGVWISCPQPGSIAIP